MSAQDYIEGGPASLLKITGAILYDFLILFAILMILAVPFVALNDGEAVVSGSPLYATQQSLFFLIIFGYFADSWVRRGQTIGMLAWKIKLISNHNKNVNLWQALLRFCSAFAGIGNIWMLLDKQMRSWHDIFSETHIIQLLPADKADND